ncbi:hypothetical protein PUN28_002552 [Cardiocondyla obscurior]|uniref:Secreted protein n=1 Tax=Cardiocondyla obscurior TaxID=286306 RepID=A0AAW2GUT2_9HYME
MRDARGCIPHRKIYIYIYVYIYNIYIFFLINSSLYCCACEQSRQPHCQHARFSRCLDFFRSPDRSIRRSYKASARKRWSTFTRYEQHAHGREKSR